MNWHALSSTLAFAGLEVSTSQVSGTSILFEHIAAAVIFSITGLVAFGVSLWIINRLSPFSLRKELEEDQNTAVAVIIGAIIIGMAIIIASAIHG